jgi:hypothetical protein
MSGECDKCGEHALECVCHWEREWISVKDRVPPIGKAVLTYFPEAKYCTCFNAAWYDGEDFWFDMDGSPVRGITHWMPLPEPPESVTN